MIDCSKDIVKLCIIGFIYFATMRTHGRYNTSYPPPPPPLK